MLKVLKCVAGWERERGIRGESVRARNRPSVLYGGGGAKNTSKAQRRGTKTTVRAWPRKGGAKKRQKEKGEELPVWMLPGRCGAPGCAVQTFGGSDDGAA